jgi:hypothetical protein
MNEPIKPTPPDIAILYHKADWDGIASGLVIKWFLLRAGVSKENIHLYGMDYGDPLPDLAEREDPLLKWPLSWREVFGKIFIVDFTCPALMDETGLRDRIIWLDHHASAIAQYEGHGFMGARVDGVAACRIAWQWGVRTYVAREEDIQTGFPDLARFNEGTTILEPPIIRLLGEWDVWDHHDPDAARLQYGLGAMTAEHAWAFIWRQLSLDPEEIDKGMVDFWTRIHVGRFVQRYMERRDRELAAQLCHTVQWRGLKFCCRQTDRKSSLAFAGAVKPEHDALLAWHLKSDGQVSVSLYRVTDKPSVDILSIAVAFGGGGHPGACGFRLRWFEFATIMEALLNLRGDANEMA